MPCPELRFAMLSVIVISHQLKDIDIQSQTHYRLPVTVISNTEHKTIADDSRDIIFSDQRQVNRFGRTLTVVPPSLVLKVLIDSHDNSGHPGIRKTVKQIQSLYYWPEMRRDIKAYVQTYHSCQVNKVSNHSTFGSLQPLQTPDSPLDLISTDTVVIGSSANNTSHKYLQVVLDHNTRYIWAKPTKGRTPLKL